jgi:tRNA-(ms[2]io[6]A)-hydroxylase
MLHLASKTDPVWVHRAVAHMDQILLDHAHCEKKAASTAVGLLFKYPHFTQILRPLSALAREELAHFELVLDHLDARGQVFRKLPPSPYAGRLMSIARKNEPGRLVDMLLCCAVIEARSCERMQLLAETLTDPALVGLYAGLVVSEARHFRTYVDLAVSLVGREAVAARLPAITDHEAEILAMAPSTPRMHN